MSKTTFKTNPRSLEELLRYCESGKIQLPDFQRSWVWAEDRILSLIASVSRAFPIGALMTLESKTGEAELFARRRLEGTPTAADEQHPDELLLDGQQRMTSLYQACVRKQVIKTMTPQKRIVKRWFYIDIRKAIAAEEDRDEAILSIPEDRVVRTNFNKDIVLDLSRRDLEYQQFIFPLNQVFDWDEWQEGFDDYWIERDQPEQRKIFKNFKNEVLANFKHYQVPVIALADDTPHEAVCLVFEKVNTGGKALDAFELLTAMYAAQGHKLRDDWLGVDGHSGIQGRLKAYGRASEQKEGVLANVANTDFLQAISLLHTKRVRREKQHAGVNDSDLPAIRATRQSLLDLPLAAYLEYRDLVEHAFQRVAKFLRENYIHRVFDLPYQSQLVPLAAIFAELGDRAEHTAIQAKISRWYWCGLFGELYGSAAESRFARDIAEVPAWLEGGPEPSTVRDGQFWADRLYTMRTRLSAAYKGVHALLMRHGARDFRSGQKFDTTVFFEDSVDIHHIFPENWCKKNGIEPKIYNSIINKTPLSYRTNRIIGGVAPSTYLNKLETGVKDQRGQEKVPPIDPETLNNYLKSHCIPVDELRRDDFDSFMLARKRALLQLIEQATGHSITEDTDSSEEQEYEDEVEPDEFAVPNL